MAGAACPAGRGFSFVASSVPLWRGIGENDSRPNQIAPASARRSAPLLLSRSPSATVDGGRSSPQGRAHDARVRRQRKDALSANLGRRPRTRSAGCTAGVDVGVPFLLVTFLRASKEK